MLNSETCIEVWRKKLQQNNQLNYTGGAHKELIPVNLIVLY